MDLNRAPDGRSLEELLLELDRLEELREDMLDLGVRTIEELEGRIAELGRLVDQQWDAGDGSHDDRT